MPTRINPKPLIGRLGLPYRICKCGVVIPAFPWSRSKPWCTRACFFEHEGKKR